VMRVGAASIHDHQGCGSGNLISSCQELALQGIGPAVVTRCGPSRETNPRSQFSRVGIFYSDAGRRSLISESGTEQTAKFAAI
jgi:hypothetical protein